MVILKYSIRFITCLLFAASALYALLTINQLADSSWLTTIDALGGGGKGSLSAKQEAWIELLGTLLICVAAVIIFLKTFKKKKTI